MSVVNILNIQVLDNPTKFLNPFQFEITFECISSLKEGKIFEYNFLFIYPVFQYTDLEWKIIYVGSAEDDRYDQVLDSIMVGPIPVGINKFVFQVNSTLLYFYFYILQTESPNPSLIPETDLVGVTVVLIVCSYNEQEFVRVGYYVNNEYEDPEMRENPPEKIDLSKVSRNILSEKPRVTRVPIRWDNLDENPEPVQDENANYEDFAENGVISYKEEFITTEMEA